jgi:hypothetical protein
MMRKRKIGMNGKLAALILISTSLTSCVYVTRLEFYEPHAAGIVATPVATRSSIRAVEAGPNTFPTINNALDLHFGELRLRVTADSSFMASDAAEKEPYVRISLALDPGMQVDPTSCVIVTEGTELKSLHAKYAPDVHKVGGSVDLVFRAKAWPGNFDLHIRMLTIDGKTVNVPVIHFERQTSWNWGAI